MPRSQGVFAFKPSARICKIRRCENLGDPLVHDENGDALNASELRGGSHIEKPKDFLEPFTASETTSDGHLTTVSIRLPVMTRHELVGDQSPMRVIDIDERDADLSRVVLTVVHPGHEVVDSIGVQIKERSTVVLRDGPDHRFSIGVFEDDLPVFEVPDERFGVAHSFSTPVEAWISSLWAYPWWRARVKSM